MSVTPDLVRHWILKRIDPTIRVGGQTAYRGVKKQNVRAVAMGSTMVAYGLLRRSRVRRLIYETSMNVDQGMTIRVKQGRRVIAETTPRP